MIINGIFIVDHSQKLVIYVYMNKDLNLTCIDGVNYYPIAICDVSELQRMYPLEFFPKSI